MFLTNVNSLIQELRNIPPPPHFICRPKRTKFQTSTFGTTVAERLKNDEYAVWVKETRNLVVHQSALAAASHFNIKFLTYYELPVASLLTDSDSDPSVVAILARKDLQSIITRVHNLMQDQGDAIIAIERCWSTPELKGANYSHLRHPVWTLSSMVLDADVHLAHLDCVDNTNTDSEFPTHRGRTALLPCMMKEQAARTDYFTLNAFTPLSKGVSVPEFMATIGDVEWRYQMKVGERLQVYDSFDPVKLYEQLAGSKGRC